jgi:phage-related protein
MNDRKITAYKHYYKAFEQSLDAGAREKVHRSLDLLASLEHIHTKVVVYLRGGLFQLKAENNMNVCHIFFIYENDKTVVLLNGFQLQTRYTPESEIRKAIQIRNEYHASKSKQKSHRRQPRNR